MENKRSVGHLTALFTVIIWGTTFISTKVLLVDFQPAEILLFRFVLGFVALLLVCPRQLRTEGRKQELLFAAAAMRDLPVLSAGKYRADLYHGFQCGGHYIRCALFYSYFISSVREVRGKASVWFFHRLRGGHGRRGADQF